MNITYFGHSCFKLESESSVSIIIDPYQNSEQDNWFEKSFPSVSADMVISTHMQHADHNAINAVTGNNISFTSSGEKTIKDVKISLYAERHAKAQEYGEDNAIVYMEMDGVRICHWGDNQKDITKKTLKNIYECDILMIPVDDSQHILSYKEVDEIISYISPKIIIPMHYFIPGLSSAKSPLKSVNEWLNSLRIEIKHLETQKVELNALPDNKQVWVFKI